MTTPIDPVERRLPGAITDLAAARTPDYLVDILGQTARTRQRPAWTFPERWFPMADIARQPVRVQRMPFRPIVILALIALLAAAAVGLYIGTRPHVLPTFGPARNGLVAYSLGGTVYTADPVTGTATAIVAGDGAAIDPRWTTDGSQLLFQRTAKGRYGNLLFIVRPDGSGLTQVTPDVVPEMWSYSASADDRLVLIGHVYGSTPGSGSLSIANADGSGMRRLDMSFDVYDLGGIRPSGSEILFSGARPLESTVGIYLVAMDGTGLRTLVEPAPNADVETPSWSPDGSRIAYARWEQGGTQLRTHVMNADGRGDHVVGHKEGAWFEGQPTWSPDGTRLLIHRDEGTVGEFGGATPTIVSVDGGAPELTIAYSTTPNGDIDRWSPDGTKIQVVPFDDKGNAQRQLLWDATTGASTTAPWTATSFPAWQRIAP